MTTATVATGSSSVAGRTCTTANSRGARTWHTRVGWTALTTPRQANRPGARPACGAPPQKLARQNRGLSHGAARAGGVPGDGIAPHHHAVDGGRARKLGVLDLHEGALGVLPVAARVVPISPCTCAWIAWDAAAQQGGASRWVGGGGSAAGRAGRSGAHTHRARRRGGVAVGGCKARGALPRRSVGAWLSECRLGSTMAGARRAQPQARALRSKLAKAWVRGRPVDRWARRVGMYAASIRGGFPPATPNTTLSRARPGWRRGLLPARRLGRPRLGRGRRIAPPRRGRGVAPPGRAGRALLRRGHVQDGAHGVLGPDPCFAGVHGHVPLG